jgi:hypothetical protein
MRLYPALCLLGSIHIPTQPAHLSVTRPVTTAGEIELMIGIRVVVNGRYCNQSNVEVQFISCSFHTPGGIDDICHYLMISILVNCT